MPEEQKKSIDVEVQEELEIDDTKLNEEMIRQPSKFYYWAANWARAARSKRKQRIKVRETESTLSADFRKKMTGDSPGTRVTEKMIEDYLYAHPTYKEELINLVDKEHAEDVFSNVKDAFKERHQVLLELSRTAKDEQLYGDELKAMKQEFDAREAKKIGKRGRKQVQEDVPQ